MFEGLVRQLLLGYLGRYVKDIHKEQLKITLWNEEVLLENVELILEAFDYLQLPFALKQGRVGRLSIRIPWKKLGWDPIIISLEDVYVCASQRDDQEWSLEAVERREFAGKRAKLAAAELAKLSRRVCDNDAGQSFISSITAKVLDSIQVSIRNFHVLYSNVQLDSADVIFGLKLSSLTIMKQNLVGSFTVRSRGGQVSKTIEIKGLGFYCSKLRAGDNLKSFNDIADFKFWSNARGESNEYDHILRPFDVTVSLVVNRAGELDNDLPQYSINAELTKLVFSIDDFQLQQSFVLLDYLCTSRLREKYGRYRPRHSALSSKPSGWQRIWWQYAQQSVLSDVHKKLKKTSWRYLGQRLSNRRKYVNLYKSKLHCLHQEQSVDESVVRELEQIEKDCDFDDILSYRTAAECELQEVLLKSSHSSIAMNDGTSSIEKSPDDEHSSGRSRGWLNWLSRGMLGATGTDDSSQFSGVVSDEVVKDIYEATEFHPVVLSSVDADGNDKFHICAIKFSIGKMSATVRSRNSGLKIAKLKFGEAVIDCNTWEDSANVIIHIKSVTMLYPWTKKVILRIGGACTEENTIQSEQSSFIVQVDVSPVQDVDLSVKVMLQPLEAICDRECFLKVIEFSAVFMAFESHYERVIATLNGIEDDDARILSKVEYVLSNRKKVIWDISIVSVTVAVPWAYGNEEEHNLVLDVGSLHIKSKPELDSRPSIAEEHPNTLKRVLNSTASRDFILGFQLQDLYNLFDLKLNDCEMKLVMPCNLQTVSILENLSASITLASCVIPEEAILNQSEVHFLVSRLQINLSPLIYKSAVGLIVYLDVLLARTQVVMSKHVNHHNTDSDQAQSPFFGLSISATLESVTVMLDLANDGEGSSILTFALQGLDFCYSVNDTEECSLYAKALKIVSYPMRDQNNCHILASCGDASVSGCASQPDMGVGRGDEIDNRIDGNPSSELFFLLHYEVQRSVECVCNKLTVVLNNADLHCFPHIIGLLIRFFDQISSNSTPSVGEKSSVPTMDHDRPRMMPSFGFRRFGFSNFSETWSTDYANISLYQYPFITICNSGFLGSLDSSLLQSTCDWRKRFKLRDKKIRSPKCSLKKGCETSQVSSLMSTRCVVPLAEHCSGTNQFFVDISLCGIRIHFHDSSCIIGTVTIPSSKSSLMIHEESMDLLFSAEGLVLTSPWFPNSSHKWLWGPSLLNLSPIINLRARTGKFTSLSSQLEINLGIQHVCCVLQAEFLTIIIGYFSSADWGFNSTERSVTENCDSICTENKCAIVYKFEVLDSNLIVPVEDGSHQFLKLEVPQLYSSFIDNCALSNIVEDIPPEFMVAVDKVGKCNKCLNLFGRDLVVSFFLFKDGEHGCSMFDQDTGYRSIMLIAPLSADILVRIPMESETRCERSPASTCIMSRIYNCQLMVNDCHALKGFKVLLDVIDKFSCVDDESNLYRFDVLRFLHQKEHLEECTAVPPVNSGMNFMEVSCSVDSLLVNLHDVREGFVLQKPVAKLDMQFMFSASLVNETLLCLESKFSSAALYSLSDSLMLARCTNNGASSSVLDICFSKSGVGHELCVSLPCLDIWLHLSNWTELIELYNTCAQKMEKDAHINVSSRCSATCKVDPVDTMMMPLPQTNGLNSSLTSHHLSENTKQGTGILIFRSENIGITFRIPLLVYEPQMAEKQVPPHDDFSTHKRDSKFIAITVQSKSSELRIAGRNIQLKAIMDKISGNVMTCDKHHVKSLPFFQILQVNVATEICCDQMVLVRVNLHVQCDKLDAWLSHQVLAFWRGAVFDIPEAGSTQLAFPCIDLKIQFRKISLLISDGRWSCSEHLLEIVVLKFLVDMSMTEIDTNGSITSELQVNYNNIRKVLWEPFIEPWRFQMKVIRKYEIAALLNKSITTDIDFTSTTQLNLNFTEPLAECIFRVVETIKDALGLRPDDRPENQVLLNPQFTETASGGRYAPYILQNLTSLPLLYHVYQGLPSSDEFSAPDMKNENLLQPGSSVPVYLNESPEDQLFRYRSAYSSDKLSEKQSSAAAHHFMTLQVDASSVPSSPISMDLVGLTYFEVDFSKASKKVEFEKTGDASKYNMSDGEDIIGNSSSGFVVPVVFDVSVQHYGKLIRLYSTVIISNATSIPLELRFDIPFGVSPKILDPIYPGQEFPLPLHLAGAGRMRWRPLGNSYLWSEAHNVSNILSLESKIGHLRSFVCYPSHPSSAPFRCCISVQNILLPTFGYSRKGLSFHVNNTCSHPSESSGLAMHELDHSKRQFIHTVTLSTPFLVKNYLPEAISLAIETSGISRTLSLSEIQTSFHDIDPSHDLTLGFSMLGFRPSIVKFARAETFSTMGKVNESKFSLSETVTFDPELPSDSIHIVVEKTMDAFAGSRELLISVPYILYNCTGFPIIVSHCAGENIGSGCSVSSCYDLAEQGPLQGGKDGLCLLSSSDEDNIANTPEMDGPDCPLSKNYIVSTRKNVNPYLKKFLSRPLISSPSFKLFNDLSEQHDLRSQKRVSDVNNHVRHSSQSSLSETNSNYNGYGKVRAFMYSPLPLSASSEIMVRVSSLTECVTKTIPNVLWSMPFPLVPPSGSTTVTIPQSSSSAAFVVSVTSSGLGGPFAGRTRAITFQPRYVISNACSKDVCYKQKGTDFVFRLRVGQHSHLHWTDTARELLVSVRFSEPGWQWSGSFLPDQLGDTQLKMRNYVSGALNMIRVEVQNADVSFRDEKIVGNLHGNYGTNLILLSDDETGYMPYRIDNFSKERLRIYQYRCETFDTIIHPYTSCPYAWDEPCCPHRLTVEVPGERVVGSYALDDLRELIPVHLQSTSEKPERTLLLSNHAEGATKVLSIVDSNCHILKDVKNPVDARFQEKRKQEKKQEINYRERISIRIPYIGISLINSHPQELLFACARNVTIDLLQSLDQQKLIFQIYLLQIDNQLPTTPYPVILSFNEEHRSYPIANRISDANSKYEKVLQTASSCSCEPVIYLSLAMWKKRDISLVSFQHINLRVADFLLELEQEVILGVLDFVKNVSPWFRSEVLSFSSSPLQPVVYDLGFENDSSVYGQRFECLREKPDQIPETNEPTSDRNHRSASFPSIVPIGAPWQKIYLLARRQKKIYVELLDLSPIKFTLSFSSAPRMLKNGAPASGESLIHRGLMALADVEGARIHLKQLTVSHHMASWESIQEILMRHYTRQLLHEMYKVFGSAGVIGNPMGFARSLGLGFRDFLSVPAKSMLQSPTGLISGVAQGTTSLVSNTVYALSDAATQFSKAAHKGIVAITFDDQTVARMEKQQKGVASHSKGVINEVLEGLTGLLQSPIKEVEKHGLPGVLSGIALGVTGLVARPAASILEVTGKTAQSIRNRSKLYRLRSLRCRIRLPRPLSRELSLRPYSWEEAIGTSVLMEADDGLKFKDEVLITCKTLEQAGKFVVLTERVILVVGCSSLVDLGKPEFRGVAVDLEWAIESEISLDSVIHADTEEGTVHIVGSSSDGLLRKKQQQLKRGSEQRTKWWNNPSTLPLFQTNLELKSKEDAEELLRILLSTIEQGKGRRWGSGYLLHQCNIK